MLVQVDLNAHQIRNVLSFLDEPGNGVTELRRALVGAFVSPG